MPSSKQPTRTQEDGAQVLRGVGMGLADVVPGVSGGTIALVLGIYPRLVGAISRFDLVLLDHLRHRRWKEAAQHIDLRFLATLAIGIGLGVLTMTMVMNRLLVNDQTRPLTYAAFFGMIFASGLLVARMIRPTSAGQWAQSLMLGGAGAAFACFLILLKPSNVDPSLPYLFLCGMIAICAMILPGVSGAMILLLLGVFHYLSDAPHRLLHGEMWADYAAAIPVFGAGCALGLVAFSKLLRWLLSHRHSATMAVLCGFMFGSLPKLWPFQRDLTPEIAKFKEKQFAMYLPDFWQAEVLGVVAAAFLAGGLVFFLEWFRHRSESETNSIDPQACLASEVKAPRP